MHFPGAPPAIDGRSDAKGPETECVATSITCKRLASIGVECKAGVYVYNISTPAQSLSRDDLADCTIGTDCTDCDPRTDCTDCDSRTYASAIVGTEITCNLNDGHETLVCIWAATSPLGRARFLAATPLAGVLTEYIIECGPLRGNDGSSADTSLYRNPVGKSTINPHASCRGAACTRAGFNSTTADGPRKGARKVFEIALEELFIKGKIGDAEVKYSFPYEDTAGDPNEKAADLDGVPWEWVEVVDLAFVLLRLALFVWAICASWRRSGLKERFAYQTHRNQRFALVMLVLVVVPRSSAMVTTAPPDSAAATDADAERTASAPNGLSERGRRALFFHDHHPHSPHSHTPHSHTPHSRTPHSLTPHNHSHAPSWYPPDSGPTPPRSSSTPPMQPQPMPPLPFPPPPHVWMPSPPPPSLPLMPPAPLPCTMLPCSEASDNDIHALHSVQHVPSHRRLFFHGHNPHGHYPHGHHPHSPHSHLPPPPSPPPSPPPPSPPPYPPRLPPSPSPPPYPPGITVVSNTVNLTSALANPAVGHIVLAPGTYILNAELSITRSVVLEAAVAGSAVLNAQSPWSPQRRVLLIDPGQSGVVQILGLAILGGIKGRVRASHACKPYCLHGRLTFCLCVAGRRCLRLFRHSHNNVFLDIWEWS